MDEIFSRRSIRRFKPQPVEKDKIEALLRAAMAAPSAKNQRPWEFFVTEDPHRIALLSESSPYASPVGRAPLCIGIFLRKESLCPGFQDIDGAIAAENLWLEATSLGLGAVMIGISPSQEREAKVESAFGAPEALRAFCLFAIGYPEEEKPPREHTFEPERIHDVDE